MRFEVEGPEVADGKWFLAHFRGFHFPAAMIEVLGEQMLIRCSLNSRSEKASRYF